ncbi:TIM barrel protein [Paenibacillus sp. LMG 31456]|uniref:TIM barrel protein n=1 Tax=Paenibacillus foliorum TaxID=2654974 RepID=A0A972JZF2_9BACL|nr:sugar phosphate isomerase/epimerase family protein [Paenibacillus foliorum]NOU92680.1 TIM barrel protein [Paenibacillus foliorum]
MRKGINQWCFPKGTPLEKIFETSSQAGFDEVELNLYAPGGVGLTMDTSEEEARAIGRLAQHYGLTLSTLSSELLGQYPLSSPEPEVRELGVKAMLKQIEIAVWLGMDTILVVPGRVNDQVAYEQCYERSRTELSKLLPALEAGNIHMGIENVWNKFMWSPLEMAKYIDDFGSPLVCAYFDVGNTLLFGLPQQWIRILGHRIRKVHVKDFKSAVGNGNGFVPLLAGDVDWKEVRLALNEIGYNDVLTAELTAYASAPDQLVFDTARHIGVIMGDKPH